MASFSFGENETPGYSGQGIQHPAAKQALKSTAYGFSPYVLLLAEKKKAELQVTLFHFFVRALVSMYSCAIIRLPCFILKVLLQFPAGCQLLASSESLKAVHLFRD